MNDHVTVDANKRGAELSGLKANATELKQSLAQ